MAKLQEAIGTPGTGANPTLAFPNPVGAGNLLVVFAFVHADEGFSSITDTLGNTWQQAVQATNTFAGAGNDHRCTIWYTRSVTGGANTVTVGFSASANSKVIAVAEFDPQGEPEFFHGNNATVSTASHPFGSGTSFSTPSFVLAAAITLDPVATTSGPAGYTALAFNTTSYRAYFRYTTAGATYASLVLTTGASTSAALAAISFVTATTIPLDESTPCCASGGTVTGPGETGPLLQPDPTQGNPLPEWESGSCGFGGMVPTAPDVEHSESWWSQ